MSTDLEEPEVETEAVETEMIVLAKDKSAANDALISRLSNDWLPLKCNGADDKASFKIVKDAHWRMVKYRTGLKAHVAALIEPHETEIDRIKKQAAGYQGKLSVVELHLKAEIDAVKAELDRREQERLDELFDLRKRRWLEATGNPPDFEGFPESMLRNLNEADFEAEIQRLTEKTRLEREATIKRIEAETQAAKQRADEAAALKKAADDLKAQQDAFALQQREAKAALDLQAQQQREAQEKIDAETRRLDSERRAKEEAPEFSRETTAALSAAAAPSMESAIDSLQRHGLPTAPARSISAPGDFHLAFDDQGFAVVKFRLMEFTVARSEGDGIAPLDDGETDLWLQIVDTLNKHFPRE